MKNSKTCPKCSSQQIVRIEEWDTHGIDVGSVSVSTGWLSTVKAQIVRYLCLGCGFSEEWLDDEQKLAAIRDKLADQIISATSVQEF